mmetsp:Transcript_3841/g.4729  ORF Transcript_3841/g.4729 Transcript_3841/m.4729 type:complete len:120 (+) Transcript_3841:31-390(+)
MWDDETSSPKNPKTTFLNLAGAIAALLWCYPFDVFLSLNCFLWEALSMLTAVLWLHLSLLAPMMSMWCLLLLLLLMMMKVAAGSSRYPYHCCYRCLHRTSALDWAVFEAVSENLGLWLR